MTDDTTTSRTGVQQTADTRETGPTAPPSEYQYDTIIKGRGDGIADETVNDVFDAVRAAVGDGQSYVSAAILDVEGCDRTAIGKALSALADDDACPLDLTRWSGTGSTPTVWRVESGERRAVADGGLPDHVGLVNGLGEGPDWYRCQECGAVGDDLDDIDHHERCPGERRAVADGGVAPQDLTLFQLEILYTLAEHGPDYGLGIKGALEDRYETDIHHGRLYPNLDALAEKGLVDRSQRDGRTNEYALTDSGHGLVASDAYRRATVYGQDIAPEDIVPSEPVADGGSRYGYSWTTDTWYEVTEYVNLGDGDIQAQEKHEVDREEVPQDVLDATNERDGDLVTDGGQEPVKNREWITEQLDAVPVVEWDRFTVDSVDGDQVVTVYGWIDRDDEYKDFVWTRFYPGNEWCEYTTSSEQWTDYLNAEWFGEDSSDTHTECRRVENAFDVENCIELTGQQELATDAGQSDTEGSR